MHIHKYVDLGVICRVIPTKEFHNFLQGLVDSGFGDRIMFGSDQMVWLDSFDDAIEVIIDFVNSENPTLRLPLGKLALMTIGMKLDSVKADLESNKEIAENAVFE